MNQEVKQETSSEFEQMKASFRKAKLSAFLIVPLKYESEELNLDWLEENAVLAPIQTADVSDSVRDLMNSHGKDAVLRRYQIPQETVLKTVLGENRPARFYACDQDQIAYTENQEFTLHDMEVYIFHTKVAFLCVKIQFKKMAVLNTITNLGYADQNILYFYEDAKGKKIPLDFEKRLMELCKKTNLQLFNTTGGSIFLEAYTYTTAVVPERFQELATVRQASFNLHLMVDPDTDAEDQSEEDIQYVYAAKDQKLHSYRWGSCITSQTISYVVARDDLNIDKEMREQSENGLPIVLMALYQKYTCLRYQTILSDTKRFTPKSIKQMKKKLLEFQAFGTIAPANISRWHNIKQTYKHLLEENDIPEAIDKMSLSLNILANQQKEIADARSNAVLGLITVFGVVSIPSSVISILDIMHGSNPINRLATIISLVSMAVMIIVLLLYKREDR